MDLDLDDLPIGPSGDVDEQPLEESFSLRPVPQQFETEDGHQQDVIHAGIQASAARPQMDHVAQFHVFKAAELRLSTLRKIYEQRNVVPALRALAGRRHLKVDDEFKMDSSHKDVLLRVERHYLDYVLFLGNRMGLDAALPNTTIDHTLEFTLNFCNSHRLWPSGSSKDLPFDPHGRMLFIGQRRQEEIWIAMVPKQLVRRNEGRPIPKLDSPTTAMATHHALRLILFFAFVMSEVGLQDLHCRDRYPSPLDKQGVRAVTDIFGRDAERNRTIRLTLHEFKRLHMKVLQKWDEWVEDAPDEYKQDGFITNHLPVALTIRYGQNQEMGTTEAERNRESEVWEKDHDFRNIMRFTFALASHISYIHVREWDVIPHEELLEKYGEGLYSDSNMDIDECQPIEDLSLIELLDESGREIPIYDTLGFRVPRRRPAAVAGAWEPLGSMLNLLEVDRLFYPRDGVNFAQDRQTRIPLYLYPMAYTKTLGNIQADGIICPFQGRIVAINEEITHHVERNDQEEHDDDSLFDDRHDSTAPALLGLRCQIYNSFSHRIRDRAKFHPVQLGKVTSALSGSGSGSTKTRQVWEKSYEYCQTRLPHQRFSDKIDGPNQPQAMRFENVYRLEVREMKPRYRNGRSIFDRVIVPLLDSWKHPSITEHVKGVLVPLKHNVIPSMFQWTTYPITVLLEIIWKKTLPVLAKDEVVDPHIVEMVSVLERALNFAHTGSARVLQRSLMDRTYLSLGIIFDGFPCFSDNFVSLASLRDGSFILQTGNWPQEGGSGKPLTSSQRSQVLTYGIQHYEIYLARFTLKRVLDQGVPDGAYPDIKDINRRLSHIVFGVAIQAYLNDIKSLVVNAVLEDMGPQPSNRPADIAARCQWVSRNQALQRWRDSEYPLSCTANILADLTRAVIGYGQADPRLQASALGSRSLQFLANQMLKQAQSSSPRRIAPFVREGGGRAVMKVAVAELQPLITDADPEALFSSVLVEVLQRFKVNHVPWHPDRRNGPGAPPSSVCHYMWLALTAMDCSSTLPSNASPLEAASLQIQQASTTIAHTHPMADWEVLSVRLKDFHTIVHKARGPLELSMAHVSAAGSYIQEMYEWTINNFDFQKPIHFLALFTSVAFACLTPRIFAASNSKGSLTNDATGAQRIEHFRNMDWVTKENHKGNVKQPPFILMWTSFVLGCYEPTSPIGTALRHGVSLNKWYEKNTAKGITHLALCRFGLAVANNARLFKSHKWGADVSPLSEDSIRNTYNAVRNYLISSPRFGAYDAIEYLAGPKTTDVLVAANVLDPRPFLANNLGKRPFSVFDSDDVAGSSSSGKHSRIV